MTPTPMEKLERVTRIFGLLLLAGGTLGVAFGLLHARAAGTKEGLTFDQQTAFRVAGYAQARANALIGCLPGALLFAVSRWAKKHSPPPKDR